MCFYHSFRQKNHILTFFSVIPLIHRHTLLLYLWTCHTLLELITGSNICASKVTMNIIGHRKPADSKWYPLSLESCVPEASVIVPPKSQKCWHYFYYWLIRKLKLIPCKIVISEALLLACTRCIAAAHSIRVWYYSELHPLNNKT